MQPALSNATLISGQSETRCLKDRATKGARMYWGGGQKSEKQRQNEADNETYLPFSTTTEWLSNNHIMHCTLYLLHMQYPNAKHQNMTAVTHSVVQHNKLLFKEREASGHVPMMGGTLRKTLSRDGPSPAIVVGDGIHWRIILTDARSQTVAFIDPFGSGFLKDIITAIKTFYNSEPGTQAVITQAMQISPELTGAVKAQAVLTQANADYASYDNAATLVKGTAKHGKSGEATQEGKFRRF